MTREKFRIVRNHVTNVTNPLSQRKTSPRSMGRKENLIRYFFFAIYSVAISNYVHINGQPYFNIYGLSQQILFKTDQPHC